MVRHSFNFSNTRSGFDSNWKAASWADVGLPSLTRQRFYWTGSSSSSLTLPGTTASTAISTGVLGDHGDDHGGDTNNGGNDNQANDNNPEQSNEDNGDQAIGHTDAAHQPRGHASEE